MKLKPIKDEALALEHLTVDPVKVIRLRDAKEFERKGLYKIAADFYKLLGMHNKVLEMTH